MAEVKNAMEFNPKTCRITIDWHYLKQFRCYKRQAIALFVHELVHLFEWIFVYHFDALKWNSAKEPEKIADFCQDFILKILRYQQ